MRKRRMSVRRARLTSGLSAEALAARLGLPVRAYLRLERHPVHFRVEHVPGLKAALRVPLDDIFFG